MKSHTHTCTLLSTKQHHLIYCVESMLLYDKLRRLNLHSYARNPFRWKAWHLNAPIVLWITSIPIWGFPNIGLPLKSSMFIGFFIKNHPAIVGPPFMEPPYVCSIQATHFTHSIPGILVHALVEDRHLQGTSAISLASHKKFRRLRRVWLVVDFIGFPRRNNTQKMWKTTKNL